MRQTRSAGFRAFLCTQFLGALNDNLYKVAVSLRAARSSHDLALAGAVFVLPFLLFSGYSGWLADRFPKRSVLIAVKVFEIGVMAAGLAALLSGSMSWMLLILFLMALHSTVFSPAKYGIVPEMVGEEELSRANGLLEMTTFVAIVLGASLSTALSPRWVGALTLTSAAVGFLSSLRIPRTAAPAAHGPFFWNPFAEVASGTRHVLRDRPLWLAVLGISGFWMVGALLQMDLLLFGSGGGTMLVVLAVGIGAGSLLAGKVSGDRVEMGLAPLGAALMGASSLWFAAARSIAALAVLGLAGGLFIVPLNAFLQQRSGKAEKGRILATNNLYNTVGLLFASAALWAFHDRMGISPVALVVGTGILTLAATVYVAHLLRGETVRFLLRAVLRALFRVRVEGVEHVPQTGGALLVSNHVSFLDGLLLGAATRRNVRFMVWRPYYQHPALHWFFRQIHAIPVGAAGPHDTLDAIAAAREQLKQGRVVCIFAEGAITRTGHLQPFKRGLERIAAGLDAPVVPVYLDRLWGSIFSYAGGKPFSRWPQRVPYPVTICFGAPMPSSATAPEVHQAVLELSADAVALRKEPGDTLPARFIRSARRHWSKLAVADSGGQRLTYGRALAAGLLISDWVSARTGLGEEIGVLLPASAGGALANAGVTLAGRVPVNLNFTAGEAAMAAALRRCAIRMVITSRAFLEKSKVPATPDMTFLEDVLGSFTLADKVRALLRARLTPARKLAGPSNPDALAAVLFSSGSSGVPKGVMLSHYNVIANIEAMLQVFDIRTSDRVAGVLPFFHSFGFTVTLWLPLLSGCGAVYHSNPMDARIVGDLIQRYRGTLLLTTPTFASVYARKCTGEQFASLRLVLVGAEKLREFVAQEFEQAFGLRLLEGYGCTEMSPAVAVNTPDRSAGVGRPLPGVAVKIVDPESGAPLPAGREGLLLVKGANRMRGYFGEPGQTLEAFREEWYNTGDIAVAAEDGFLHITDRLARFSKIGGEMVPHLKIEEAVLSATGGEACAVTTLADARKGERIAVLYTASGISPEELWRRLAQTDLPKLWLPKRENIHRVEAIPMLGSGKVDWRSVRVQAEALAATVYN